MWKSNLGLFVMTLGNTLASVVAAVLTLPRLWGWGYVGLGCGWGAYSVVRLILLIGRSAVWGITERDGRPF